MKKIMLVLSLLAVLCSCELCDEVTYEKWPGGIIPYYIDPAFNESDREKIYRAINDWSKSGIIFEEKDNTGDFICKIIKTDGDASYAKIGYSKNSYIKLLPDFSYRAIQHEIGHAICLPDEIRRDDRNDHITIQWDNIENDEKEHFQYDSKIPDWYYEFEYDLHSIMHYNSVTFNSEFGKWTFIVKNNPEQYIYNFAITDKDIEKVNKIYFNLTER